MLINDVDLSNVNYNYTIEFNDTNNYNITKEKSQEVFYISSTPLKAELELHLRDLCKELDIYFPRMVGLIDLESDGTFSNYIIGHNKTSHDIGIMQLNNRWGVPWAEKILGREIDPHNPFDNIEGGIAIYYTIREHYKSIGYKGQELINMSLMSYNRGINGAKGYMSEYGKYHVYVDIVHERTAKWEKKLRSLKDPLVIINF